MTLENHLKKKYNLPDIQIINALHMVDMYDNFKEYQKDLLLLDQKSMTDIEKYVIDLETKEENYILYLLTHNYFNNYFFEVFLMLTDDEKVFEQLYEKRENLHKYANQIIDIYNEIIKLGLTSFYNRKIVQKFINLLDFKKPNLKISKFNDFWDNYFVVAALKVKNYLISIVNSFQDSEVYGLHKLDKKIYYHTLKYRVGLNINSDKDIESIYNWANKYIKYITKKVDKIAREYYQVNNLNHKELMNLFYNDKKFNFESKEEYIKLYTEEIDKYHDIVTKVWKAPLTNKCKLSLYNNQNQGRAKYDNDTFYLNTANWENTKKYDIQNLVMHEAYPGHHLQIDISKNYAKNYLGKIYGIFTTYQEGWGLFAESLHDNNDITSKFGEIDADILRTMRIIVDIDIHHFGRTAEYIINKMISILALNKEDIASEAYRYIVYPCQAMAYKIGQSVFMSHYLQKKKELGLKSIVDKQFTDEIINILKVGELPLEFMLKKFNLEFKL
jgi:hypothetical protein